MIGPLQLLVILLIIILIFGSKRLPEVGAGLGKAIQNFKKGMKGEGETSDPAPKEIEENTKDKK
ncbi:twin-arginine translocase TatA/TatE family subunit [Desulfococcaceae bacterium OttesenSCG-928-F15]|nr:twin-arginine translocase TatA/TatE family subunit [Desulfococcaceae bacterium OttesenSCG-928-F15]